MPYAHRLTQEQAGANDDSTYNTPLPPIPALPISYGDAAPILAGIAGTPLPASWVATWAGGVPDVTYSLGPGPVAVDLNVFLDYEVRRINNVVAKIPGAVEEDRIVILGQSSRTLAPRAGRSSWLGC